MYELLGLDVNATIDEIKTAYVEKVLRVQRSNGDWKKLVRAYDTLSSPVQRAEHDRRRVSSKRKKRRRAANDACSSPDSKSRKTARSCEETRSTCTIDWLVDALSDDNLPAPQPIDSEKPRQISASTVASSGSCEPVLLTEDALLNALRKLRKCTMALNKQEQRQELEKLQPLAQHRLIEFSRGEKERERHSEETKHQRQEAKRQKRDKENSDADDSGVEVDDASESSSEDEGATLTADPQEFVAIDDTEGSFAISTMLDNIRVHVDTDDFKCAVDMHVLLAEMRSRCEYRQQEKSAKSKSLTNGMLNDLDFDELAEEAVKSVLEESGKTADLLGLQFQVKVAAPQWLKGQVCFNSTKSLEEALKMRRIFADAATREWDVFRSLCVDKLASGHKDHKSAQSQAETYLDNLMKSDVEIELDRRAEETRRRHLVAKFRKAAEEVERYVAAESQHVAQSQREFQRAKGEVKRSKARIRWYKQPNLTMEQLRRGPPDDL